MFVSVELYLKFILIKVKRIGIIITFDHKKGQVLTWPICSFVSVLNYLLSKIVLIDFPSIALT